MLNSYVTLDDFIENLPMELPSIHRRHLTRIRGLVVSIEAKTIHLHQGAPLQVNLLHLEHIDKPFSLSNKWRAPETGMVIELVATESAAWYFVKWWGRMVLSQYRLHSENEIEGLALEILAGSPDDRITSDDLHVPDIYEVIRRKNRDPRVLGGVLSGLGRAGIIRSVGMVRSRRKQCHNRPGLLVWTWAIPQK